MKNLPSNISIDMYDSTIAINESIQEVIKTILEAALIVLIYSNHLVPWFVPCGSYPYHLLSTIFDWCSSSNAGDGLLLEPVIFWQWYSPSAWWYLDDAIVVLETSTDAPSSSSPLSVLQSSVLNEIAVPVIAMTLTLGAVYAPIAMMEWYPGLAI
ncbi:hypothetical protein OK016_09490 [Vibrio chagasii]|nr:hypothetical protein [Vibrio chagasii]